MKTNSYLKISSGLMRGSLAHAIVRFDSLPYQNLKLKDFIKKIISTKTVKDFIDLVRFMIFYVMAAYVLLYFFQPDRLVFFDLSQWTGENSIFHTRDTSIVYDYSKVKYKKLGKLYPEPDLILNSNEKHPRFQKIDDELSLKVINVVLISIVVVGGFCVIIKIIGRFFDGE